MIELTVEVSGEQQVIAKLDSMTDAIRERLRAALPELGAQVKEAAAGFAPSKSGKLRASLRTRLTESRDALAETVRPAAFYGRFQETGLDTMRKGPRRRGIVGVRTRLTKAGTVLVSPRRGLVRGSGGAAAPFHLPAHPFMRPAFESLKDRIVSRIRAAVTAATQEG